MVFKKFHYVENDTKKKSAHQKIDKNSVGILKMTTNKKVKL